MLVPMQNAKIFAARYDEICLKFILFCGIGLEKNVKYTLNSACWRFTGQLAQRLLFV